MKTRHHLSSLASVLVIGTLLAACSPPQPDLNDELQVTGAAELNQDPTQALSDIELNQQQQRQQQNQGQTQPLQVQQPQGDGMKTLEDFETIEAKQVTLKTSKGDITFEIYTDRVPLTSQNFLNLASEGFYDGIVFHRVINDFMAQVGDPLTKEEGTEGRWGSGGPGYTIADEFDPELKHDSAGIVSMANRGPNTGGSQFFITYEPTPWLDGKHAVFGKVTEGMDVLEEITVGDRITSVVIK